MNNNVKQVSLREEMTTLSQKDWFSRVNQQKYWRGSPWRAFGELFR